MMEVLKKQITKRFGDLPEWAADRLDRADVDTLERWSGQFLEAEQLENVFD